MPLSQYCRSSLYRLKSNDTETRHTASVDSSKFECPVTALCSCASLTLFNWALQSLHTSERAIFQRSMPFKGELCNRSRSRWRGCWGARAAEHAFHALKCHGSSSLRPQHKFSCACLPGMAPYEHYTALLNLQDHQGIATTLPQSAAAHTMLIPRQPQSSACSSSASASSSSSLPEAPLFFS